MFWQRSKRAEADTITNLTLSNYFITYWSFKKCVIETSKVVSSMFGLSIDVLTQILESWSRRTNLTLTNHLITYWTFKNCVIKTSKVVSSKSGLSLDVLTEILESWSRHNNKFDTDQLLTMLIKKCVIKTSQVVGIMFPTSFSKQCCAWFSFYENKVLHQLRIFLKVHCFHKMKIMQTQF